MAIKLEFYKDKQISFPYYFDGASIEDADFKVMFIGDSITIQEPNEDINWTKTCGMAASDIDHDYVHIVYRFLLERYHKTSICVLNIVEWEKDFTNENKLRPVIDMVKEYKPNLVIIRIGENFNKDYISNGIDPYLGFSSLVKGIKETCEKVYLTSLFCGEGLVEDAIISVALDEFAVYVKICDLSKQKRYINIGQNKKEGLSCVFPNDLGMERIAKRIIRKIKKIDLHK